MLCYKSWQLNNSIGSTKRSSQAGEEYVRVSARVNLNRCFEAYYGYIGDKRR